MVQLKRHLLVNVPTTGGSRGYRMLRDQRNPEDGREDVPRAKTNNIFLNGIQTLSKGLRRFMDGNFKVSPTIFTQVYVIRAKLAVSFT